MRDRDSVVPIIRLWGQLLVPLQGDITDLQAQKLSEEVLQMIQRTAPRGLVVDVSGLALLDSYLTSLVASLAAAARLMGVRVVVSGLSPEIAITLQTMGITLGEVTTALSLEEAMTALGVHVTVGLDGDAVTSIEA